MQKRIFVKIVDYDISQDQFIVADAMDNRFSVEAEELSFQTRTCDDPMEFLNKVAAVDCDMLFGI